MSEQHIRDTERPEYTLCIQLVEVPPRHGFRRAEPLAIADQGADATCLRCRSQARREGFDINARTFDQDGDCVYCGGPAPDQVEKWEGFCAECRDEYSDGWNEAVAGADERNSLSNAWLAGYNAGRIALAKVGG